MSEDGPISEPIGLGDQVARALYNHRESTAASIDGWTSWDDLPDSWQSEWLDAADAALSVIPAAANHGRVREVEASRLDAAEAERSDLAFLRRVWEAMGCAPNPDDFKPAVRDQMWDAVIEWVKASAAKNSRIYRENTEMRVLLASRVEASRLDAAEGRAAGDPNPYREEQ